ncbi:dsDNA nuclease domain-containing protein [Streptomyces sp. NPDC002754]
MDDPIEVEAPDDSGSTTLRRYEYQVHIAAQGVLEMLAADGSVEHVTCEHIEDIVIARKGDHRCAAGDLLWDFQQVKTRDAVEPWTLTDVLAKGALKSLWRTYQSLQAVHLTYQLTVAVEGPLDLADEPLSALARGVGHENATCLSRVAKHLKKTDEDRDQVGDFLSRVRVRRLARREDVEAHNLRVMSSLGGPNATVALIESLYTEILRLTRNATQGRLGPQWPKLLALDLQPALLLDKRLTQASVHDIRQRLQRPDHILLGEVADLLLIEETQLVRKLRRGGASNDVIEDAQMMRAHADYHRLTEVARGMWPDEAVETDLDRRLLYLARRMKRAQNENPRPADAIFDSLQESLQNRPEEVDRRPLYARDGVLLMGRACAVSDQCKFDWGTARDAS